MGGSYGKVYGNEGPNILGVTGIFLYILSCSPLGRSEETPLKKQRDMYGKT